MFGFLKTVEKFVIKRKKGSYALSVNGDVNAV